MKMKFFYMVADLENDVEESIGDSFVIVWQIGSLDRLESFDHSMD